MKRIFLLLMIAAMSVLSCKSSQVEPNDINKAKEIYKKYASRNDLTVALIGEYKGYNAVMLKAHTDEEWEFICKEFDIKPEKEINQEFINKRTVVSKSDTSSKNMEDVENFIENIGINIDSLISELHIDTLINDKEIKNRRTTVLLKSDTSFGSMDDMKNFVKNKNIDIHMDTLIHIDTSNLVMNRVSFDDIEDILDKVLDTFLVEIMKDSSVNEAFGKDPEFLKKQLREGSCDGKLTYTDYDNKTIWIYYYTTNEEFERISKDISHLFKEKKGK